MRELEKADRPDMRVSDVTRYGFRPSHSWDLDWLVSLRMETMTEYLEAAGASLSLEDHKARILDNFASIRIVTADDRDIGMLKVVHETARWRLVQLQLLPDCQRRGVGTSIIRDLLAEARRQRIPVTLSVLKVNPARELYLRLGFRVVIENKDAYEMRIDP